MAVSPSQKKRVEIEKKKNAGGWENQTTRGNVCVLTRCPITYGGARIACLAGGVFLCLRCLSAEHRACRSPGPLCLSSEEGNAFYVCMYVILVVFKKIQTGPRGPEMSARIIVRVTSIKN